MDRGLDGMLGDNVRQLWDMGKRPFATVGSYQLLHRVHVLAPYSLPFTYKCEREHEYMVFTFAFVCEQSQLCILPISSLRIYPWVNLLWVGYGLEVWDLQVYLC